MNAAQSSGYIEHNGARLYYEAEGSGPDLTLIHAGVAHLRMWDEQVAAWRDRFHVIRYDTRGWGRHGLRGRRRTRIVDDLQRRARRARGRANAPARPVARRRDGARLHGRPSGACPLSDLGRRRGARSRRAGRSAPRRDVAGDGASREGACLAAAGRDGDAGMDRWSGPAERPRGPRSPPPDGRVEHAELHRRAARGAGRSSRRRSSSTWPSCACRRSSCGATSTNRASAESGEHLATTIPGARKHEFDGVAHMVNLERPAEFNALVLDFLADVEAGGSSVR